MTNQSETEITFLNLFTVEPLKQLSAGTKIVEIYQRIVCNGQHEGCRTATATCPQQPGFISAKIHKSLDGTKVAAIAQWKTQADFDAMRQKSEFQNSLTTLEGEIISSEPHLFEVM